ncbi:DUF1461 domain-containing protein [Nesterenkonia alba]|uniref:DUF1461 domain-containing protein n=1 Tax=Nesterenkonia alba TaxID=515814 RepID=UPI0003FF4615|nr:DUF1461 domain-containing protein [Nesterenkonia alba]
MSQNPDAPREKPSEDKDFESGLDYGAFASEEPDFPEDRLSAEDSQPGDQPAPAQPSSSTGRVTRSLSEELAAARGETAEDKLDAAAAASTGAPASAAEKPASADTADADAAQSALDRDGDSTAVDTEQPTAVVPGTDHQDAGQQTTTALPRHDDFPIRAAQREQTRPGEIAPGQQDSDEDRLAALRQSTSGQDETTSPEQAPAPQPASRGQDSSSNEELTEADIEEEVTKSRRGISRFLTVLVAIFTPVLLTVAAIRLVASPAFLWVTYNRPGFPQDAELNEQDRLLYGSYGTDYLFNGADSRYLSQLAPGGEPLFTEAEVAHMTDVKLVMWWAMIIALVLLALTVLFFLLLRVWRPGAFSRGLFAGAWATIALFAGLAVVAVLNWQLFFDEFHRLLFEEGTWTFDSDAMLIRLYPEQFWIDAGMWTAGLVLLMVLIILICTWPTKARRARRAERLAEVHDRRREKLIEDLKKSGYSYTP